VTVQQFQKNGAIFKAAIDALTEEWNDRVRSIAQEQYPTVDMPGGALDRYHGARRICKEVSR